MKKKNPKESYISIRNAAHLSRVSEGQIYDWIKNKEIQSTKNSNGEDGINLSSFRKFVHTKKAKDATIKAFWHETRRREMDLILSKTEIFNKKIEESTSNYKYYISTFEDIHKKYSSKYDILRDETAGAAAYILFSRIISLLKMTTLCLENTYIESWILIRSIDEAINIAEYFCFSENTKVGENNLKLWFHENLSPPQSLCREVIADYMFLKLPSDSKIDIKSNLNVLYQQKSKLVHHTLNGIVEYYKAKTSDLDIIPLGFDYGHCTYPRKLFELVEFFQSSIWTSIQGFIHCFHDRIPLEKDDLKILIELDDKFDDEMEVRRIRDIFGY